MQKKILEVCIISDLHLGTHSCNAEALLSYLDSVKPQTLILNGDIIDGWSFKKSQFSKFQLMVISKFINLMEEGCKIVYVTGNHDEMLRRYSELTIGNLSIKDKYIFKLGGKKHWVFHGDVFDRTTKGYAKFVAQLGGKGYDFLIFLNRCMNRVLTFLGRDKMSFSKQIKASVKMAVSWIDNFEKTAAEIAISQSYDYVICGHIHCAKIETIKNEMGSVIYMNSGDWVENLTALEYYDGEWKLFHYADDQEGSQLKDEFDLKAFNEKLAYELIQNVS